MYRETEHCGQSGMSEFVILEVRHFRIMTRSTNDCTVDSGYFVQSIERISYCLGLGCGYLESM